jgi:hypothetical protein
MTKWSIALIVAAFAVLPAGAFAQGILTEDLVLTASNGTDTVTKFFPVSGSGEFKGDKTIELTNIDLDGMAVIDSLTLTYVADPKVTLAFSVRAGGAPANITISSSVLNFATIANPVAYASAAVTVTDESTDGATLTGLLGANAYQGSFDGSPWASLLANPVVAGSAASAFDQGLIPAWQSVGTPVSSMQAKFKFTLSANDSASGTSVFEVVPEPATLTLLALGFVALIRRR